MRIEEEKIQEWQRIAEIGKKAIDYNRQVAVVGKVAADNVLYFWVEGFMCCQDEKKVDVETMKELLKNSILKHGDTICYANYLITLLNDAEVILSCGLDKLRDDPTAQQHVDKIKEAILKHDSVIQQPQQPVESEAVYTKDQLIEFVQYYTEKINTDQLSDFKEAEPVILESLARFEYIDKNDAEWKVSYTEFKNRKG